MTTNSVHDQGYVPVDAWPNLTAMVESFGEPTLPPSDALAGREIKLRLDDGRTVGYEFLAAGELRTTDGATGTYTAIEARAGIFLIDVLSGDGIRAENVTIALDVKAGRATIATSVLFDRDGETRARTDFAHAAVGDATPTPHRPSSGLVGKRILYRYSEHDRYEHVYLNSGTFTWHCLRGAEKGLADTEQTRTWEIAEDLYLFFWTEAVMPVEAVLLIDLQHMRSLGRMFGWDPTPDALVHLPFSSRATLLNETTYPED